MLTRVPCCSTGLVNIIHESNDSPDKYAPGSEERDIIRRFSVLCSHIKQGRSAATKPRTAKASRCDIDDPPEPLEASIPTPNGLSGPELTNLGSTTDQPLFFPHFWDNSTDLYMDQNSFDSMDIFPSDFRGVTQKAPNAEDVLGGKGTNVGGWPSTDPFADYCI